MIYRPRLWLILAVASRVTSTTSSTFIVPHLSNGADDAPALRAALPAVRNGTYSRILFEKGTTYQLLTPVDFGTLNGVEIALEGNVSLPNSIPDVQNVVGNSSFPGAWFVLSGTNITFRGSTDKEWGWINAFGQQWWDAQNQTNRPHGFKFDVDNFLLSDMKLWKPVAWCFSLGGNNVRVMNTVIEAGSTSDAFPFNTDGFDVSGTNVYLENTHIVNGDDCITIENGATNVHAKNSYCEGGHGLSIGSLGKNGQVANVSNILFENALMVNELYAARFKSWSGGKGAAQNVTWKNVVFQNVPFPIYVTQNYWDQELGPKPPSQANSTNTAVENFTWDNFVGTIRDRPFIEGSCVTDPCWYAVPNATGKEVIIFDVAAGTESNLLARNIFPRTETGAPPAVLCDPSAVAGDVGFVCQDGRFVPTRIGK